MVDEILELNVQICLFMNSVALIAKSLIRTIIIY